MIVLRTNKQKKKKQQPFTPTLELSLIPEIT